MKKEDIERLPAELRNAAEWCEKATPGPWESCPESVYVFSKDGCVAEMRGYGANLPQEDNAEFIAHARTALPLALTYCLQMQEERDQIKNHRSIAQAELRAAEATITTLTREKEQLTNEIIRLNCTPQAVPTSVDNKIQVFRFPSHTPEGGK